MTTKDSKPLDEQLSEAAKELTEWQELHRQAVCRQKALTIMTKGFEALIQNHLVRRAVAEAKAIPQAVGMSPRDRPEKFNKDKEYGGVVPFSSHIADNHEFLNWTMWLLIKDAEHILPTGTRYQIRKAIPHNFGQDHGIAWYYSKDFKDESDTYHEPYEGMKYSGGDYVPEMGVYLVGRFKT